VVGARTNGMTAIGVLYGYGSEAELRDAGAHHICAAHPELRAHCMAKGVDSLAGWRTDARLSPTNRVLQAPRR
jgi:hypothetical protein